MGAVLGISPLSERVRLCCRLGDHEKLRRLLNGPTGIVTPDPLLVNAHDADGWTPAMWASRNGHHKCLQVLIDNNADLHKASFRDKLTPLLVANGKKCRRMVTNAITLNVKELRKACKNSSNQADVTEQARVQIAKLPKHLGPGSHNQLDDGDEHQITPLILCAFHGQHEVLALLLEANANVDKMNVWGQTACYKAAERGHDKCLSLLVKHGCDVNLCNEFGRTPVYVASLNGHTKCVEILIAAHADCNFISMNGKMPIQVASTERCETLLVPVTITATTSLNTQLLDACFGANENLPLVKELLEKIKQESTNAAKAAVTASSAGAAAGGGGGDQGEKMAPLSYVERISAGGEDGSSAMHIAALRGHINVLKLLISEQADVNARDLFGVSPLYNAVHSDDYECAVCLIKARADVNARDKEGVSPLYVAASRGVFPILRLLVAHGADLNAINARDNSTPLSQSVLNGHHECCELLLNRGADVVSILSISQQLHWQNSLLLDQATQAAKALMVLVGNELRTACMKGNFKKADEILKGKYKGVGIKSFVDRTSEEQLLQQRQHQSSTEASSESKRGDDQSASASSSTLTTAAENGNGEGGGSGGNAVVVVAEGEEEEAEHCTSLIYAILGGHVDIVRLLLAADCNANKACRGGRTPLFYAVASGNVECVKLLLLPNEKGGPRRAVDVNRGCDDENTTPLIIAAEKGDVACLALLLTAPQASASAVDLPNVYGETALYWAALKGHDEALDLLLQHKANPVSVSFSGETPFDKASTEYGRARLREEIESLKKNNQRARALSAMRIQQQQQLQQQQQQQRNRTPSKGGAKSAFSSSHHSPNKM